MPLFVGNEVPRELHSSVAEMVSLWSSSQDPKVRGGLLGKRPEEVMRQMEAGRSVVLMDGEVVVGYATLYALLPGVWEMGTVIINPRFRGRHLATLLYEGLSRLKERLGGVVWETTHSPQIVHLSQGHGLRTASYDEVPPEVRVGLCQEATCFSPDPARPGRCSDEHNVGGGCFLCTSRR